MPTATTSPRVLVIGAGARGHAYAAAITKHTPGRIVGVAEPNTYKRAEFTRSYCVPSSLTFSSWKDLIASPETKARVRAEVDAVCVCTLDETHAEIVLALRELDWHVLCEKPLATNPEDCRRICDAVVNGGGKEIVFAVGHVLRYSPHNVLLRKLVVDERRLGEVVNVSHYEPVGWWHFAHSYVRGNWRSSRTTAPSLLTKCCHDMDLLLWLLCSPASPTSSAPAHLPASVSSHGSLTHFTRSRKPVLAGNATNCLRCAAEPSCRYSAKKIYVARNLHNNTHTRQPTGWPNNIVAPEIEDCARDLETAEKVLLEKLALDYGAEEEEEEEEGGEEGKREGAGERRESYYGRCVFEAGNDVVDNQVVTLSWDDYLFPPPASTSVSPSSLAPAPGYSAKTATLTMIAHTHRICERYTKIFGTAGELTADSHSIRLTDFETEETTVFTPEVDLESGHGGGDAGLARAFVSAVAAVLEGADVSAAQREWVRCTPEEALRSHEAVFWAEKARVEKRVVEWDKRGE